VRGNERPAESSVGRLKRRADFLRVAAARRRWTAPGLILQVCPQPGLQQPETGTADAASPAEPSVAIRVGFTASRKVGNAVVRNRAKRRLRALVDELVPAGAKPGLDLVLIARPATAELPFADLRRDLALALQRTKAARATLKSPDRG
jgi:ribonuclease P protein component